MPEILARQTAALLSSALTLTLAKQPGSPGLRFPPLRTDSVRVSEQEARVVMCHALESDGRTYAVEYPTRETYSFSGVTPISARTDLVVLEGSVPVIAVEFKSGQPRQLDVNKDMEKLAVEGVRSLWFHTLESTNRRTLPTLLGKLGTGIAHAAARREALKFRRGEDHELTVAIAVLQGKQVGLWLQTVEFTQTLNEDLDAWTYDTI